MLLQVYRHVRILTYVPSLGPLVLCFRKMLSDALMLVPLLISAIFAFAAAVDALHRDSPQVCSAAGVLDLGRGPGISMLMLADFALSADTHFNCTYESAHPIFGTALLLVFALVGILVLNMLVAMMTSTFQDVYAAARPDALAPATADCLRPAAGGRRKS